MRPIPPIHIRSTLLTITFCLVSGALFAQTSVPIANPTFADSDGDGLPDGWTPYPAGDGGTRILASAPDGGLIFKDQDKTNGIGIEQWIPVQEGLNYTASADIAGTGGITLAMIFSPSIPTRAGDLSAIQLADKSVYAKAGVASSVSAVAPAGAKWVKLWLYCLKIGIADAVIRQAGITSAPAPVVASRPAATSAPSASIDTAAAKPITPKPAAPKPAGVANVMDFETGDLSQTHQGKQEGGDVTVIDATQGPVRDGQYAVKIALRKGQKRAEVLGHRCDAYGEARYGWSIYIPKEFDAQTQFSIITQWHSWGTGRESPKDGGPPTSMAIDKGGLALKLQRQGDEGWTTKSTYFPLGKVDEMRGKWTDFVMEVNWQGPGKGGWLKFYRDGKLILDYKGTTWYDDKTKGPYFKMGTYKGIAGWHGTEEGALLYVDAARMALGPNSTYQMVDPRTYAPHPVRE